MPLTQGEVGLVHWLDERLCRSDNTVTEVSAAHPSPVVSEELGSGHHVKDEEGGGKEQYLVHRLPLSHVPSLGLLDSSPCQSEGRGEEDEEGVTGGRAWIESKVSSH